MARMNIMIDDEIEEKFRVEVAKRYGLKKGNIQKALQEAMLLWISKK